MNNEQSPKYPLKWKVCIKVMTLAMYTLLLLNLRQFAQYGGLRRYIIPITVFFLLTVGGFICRLILRHKIPETVRKNTGRRIRVLLSPLAYIIVTLLFGGMILYSAIPYNGYLAWKIDAFLKEKKVPLRHDNLSRYGIAGILDDLRQSLDLPEELYMADDFTLRYDTNGNLLSLETALYYKNDDGHLKTMLISYDPSKDHAVSVHKNVFIHTDFHPDKKLSPFLQLANAEIITEDLQRHPGEVRTLQYVGKKCFDAADRVMAAPGDTETANCIAGVKSHDHICGYTAIFNNPDNPDEQPVRYITGAERPSPGQLQAMENETSDTPNTNTSDDICYFLPGHEDIGYRLKVSDAALGSRFYVLEITENGGKTWSMRNADPFEGHTGIASGMIFTDMQHGFLRLSGAGGNHAAVYVTFDGGKSISRIQLPPEALTQSTKAMMEAGLKPSDFTVEQLPELHGNRWTLQLTSEEFSTFSLSFFSDDGGKHWQYTPTPE
ncbi:MAG: hypothetical protein Q4P30_01710 [Eubacteriales bacterium]|nr:hypothetical protein [Eubacteriales bacterium]